MTGTFRSLRTARRVPPRSRFELELLEPREVPATITVTNLNSLVQTGDGVSIREALDSINAGSNANSDVVPTGAYGTSDTVLFAAGLTGTISTSTQLAITRTVTVTGPGAGLLAVVNTAAASATSRVLLVDPATAGSTVTINGLRFSGGASTANGGGILNQDAILRLNGVEVTNNTTTGKGGGISLPTTSAQLFLTDTGVRNNAATSDGGGVNLDTASPVTLLRSTISGNTCGDDGGALYFFSGGSLTMDNSTLSGNVCPNVSGNDGGAMYLWSTTTTIRNSTIANNSAGTGGAFAIKFGSTSTPLTISNSTITGNNGTSATGSGGIARTTATAVPVSLTSTIVAGNLGGQSADFRDLNINGSTGVTGSNNLIGILPAGLTITGSANLLGSAALPLNAMLGTLGNNGGNTQTIPLLAASPAVNAGSGTGADQRGQAPVGQRDIGAFEFVPVPAPPTFTSANTATFIAGTFGTFTITTTGFPLPAITRSGVLPGGVNFVNNGNGTATLSGTPALGTGGVYNLVFTAANGLPPDATQNFTLRVNQRPAITSLNNATFIAGVPGTAVVTTTGFPAPAITATSPLPNGVALLDNGDGTARITGTAFVAGSYTFNLSAGNGVLPDASQVFTLRVVLPPTFVSAGSATFTAGTPGSFTVTAIGSPLPRLSHSSGTLPTGVTFVDNGNGIGTLAGTPAVAGSYPIVFTATNGVNPDATQDFTVIVLPPPSPPTVPPTSPPVSPPPPPPPGGGPIVLPPPPLPISVRPSLLLVATPGSVAAGTEVRLMNPNTQEVVRRFVPFPGFNGEVSTALDDMTGDGVNDYAVAAGAGGGPHVKVYDGRTGAEIQSFFAFGAGFLGGVNLASGDVDGNGIDDLIVAAGPGGGPHVKAFAGGTFAEIRSFYAYAADFAGGVNVSSGDLDGDGDDEFITAARSGGGPHIKAFDGRTLAEVQSFFAYAASFTGGVNVAAGDLDGDGRAEIVTAPGAGGGPHVKAFDGRTGAEVRSFFAYGPSFNGGVSVAVGDLDGDNDAEIVTAPGAGGGPHIKAFDGRSLAETHSFFVLGDQFRRGVVLD